MRRILLNRAKEAGKKLTIISAKSVGADQNSFVNSLYTVIAPNTSMVRATRIPASIKERGCLYFPAILFWAIAISMIPKENARMNPLNAPAKIKTFTGLPKTANNSAAMTIKAMMK